MTIHIQLSVAPHFKHCTFGPCGVDLCPDSRPPHVIAEWTFDSWSAAQAWHEAHGFKDDPVKDGIASVLDNPENEYVGTEHTIMEVTRQEYTMACISIEGNET